MFLLQFIRYETVVVWLNSLIGSLGHYKDSRWLFHESKAFNLNTTHSVQNSKVIPYMEVFLIDS